MSERIYVDFNSRVTEDRIIIPLGAASVESTRYRIGDLVTLFDEELEVEARLEYDSVGDCWIGVTDGSTKRFLS